MRLKQEIDAYLKDQEGIYSQSTIKAEKRYLKQVSEYLEKQGIDRITQITEDQILNYQLYLKSQNKKNLEHLILSSLKKWLKYLRKQGKILVDPLEGIEIPKYQKRKYPKRIPSIEEMKKLLNAPDTVTPRGIRDRAIMELMYSTGIRAEETARVNPEDVDIYNEYLKVRSCKNRRERMVPIGKEAIHWINRYKQEIRQWNTGYDPDALFISLNRSRRLDAHTISAIIRGYAKQAGLGIISAHALRHACATHMLKGGANIRYIQKLLGHRYLTTTQIYTQIQGTDLTAVHARTHPRG